MTLWFDASTAFSHSSQIGIARNFIPIGIFGAYQGFAVESCRRKLGALKERKMKNEGFL